MMNCNKTLTELKENVFSAEDNALAENECNSTIEAMSDWVANTKLYKKAGGILPGSVTIFFIDSTFKDMDGIEGVIDFGFRGNAKPYGLLCSDGKYRSGKIRFFLSKPIEVPGSFFQLTCEQKDSFYTGSGNEMTWLSGIISIENLDGMSLILKTDSLNVVDNFRNKISWSCNRTIRLIKDAGKGIWGDIYSVEGAAKGMNRDGEKFDVNIDEPLIKKMELNCSKTFIIGKLSIKNDVANKTILVNYDPYNNEACDNTAEAEINGKKTLFKVD